MSRYLASIGASPNSSSGVLSRYIAKGFVNKIDANTYEITERGRAEHVRAVAERPVGGSAMPAPIEPKHYRQMGGRASAREVIDNFAREKWPENFTAGEAVRYAAAHGHSASSAYQALTMNTQDDTLTRVEPSIDRLSDTQAAEMDQPAVDTRQSEGQSV